MGTTSSVSERGILNPRGGAAHFHLARHPPSADLAYFVERYWIVRWDLRGRAPYPQETLPHPCVNLVVEPGRCAVHGPNTRRFSILLEGRGQAVAVKFKPGAFYPFVRRPMTELTDRSLPLRDVFGVADDALSHAVLASEDDAAQVALFEAFLRPRLPAHDENVAAAVRIVQTALEARAITTVDDLATRVGVATRTMQRLFQRYVGVSPKWVIRRFRIHEATERAAEGTLIDWTALAHELGYFDQAHFIKDFRAQVGRSPTAYAALCARTASAPASGALADCP